MFVEFFKVFIAALSLSSDGDIGNAALLMGLMYKNISQREVRIQHISVKSHSPEHDGEDKTPSLRQKSRFFLEACEYHL